MYLRKYTFIELTHNYWFLNLKESRQLVSLNWNELTQWDLQCIYTILTYLLLIHDVYL